MPRMPIDATAAGLATGPQMVPKIFGFSPRSGVKWYWAWDWGHCTHRISKYVLHCAWKYLKFEVKVKWRNILHFWINVTCLRKCASHPSLVSKYSLQILHGNISQISGSVGKNLFTVLLYVISPKAIGSWIENH